MLNNKVSAVILGCKGEQLSQEEKDFFAKVNPFGFILFKRNCGSKAQLKSLTDELRKLLGGMMLTSWSTKKGEG